jgi:hypothetical protein
VVRSIPLKTLRGEAGQSDIEYVLILKEVIRRPLNPQAGADIAEMRQSIRVLDELDASNGTLELILEDADYEHLKMKLLAMPWNVIDRRIVQLVDDVTNADPG